MASFILATLLATLVAKSSANMEISEFIAEIDHVNGPLSNPAANSITVSGALKFKNFEDLPSTARPGQVSLLLSSLGPGLKPQKLDGIPARLYNRVPGTINVPAGK